MDTWPNERIKNPFDWIVDEAWKSTEPTKSSRIPPNEFADDLNYHKFL